MRNILSLSIVSTIAIMVVAMVWTVSIPSAAAQGKSEDATPPCKAAGQENTPLFEKCRVDPSDKINQCAINPDLSREVNKEFYRSETCQLS